MNLNICFPVNSQQLIFSSKLNYRNERILKIKFSFLRKAKYL